MYSYLFYDNKWNISNDRSLFHLSEKLKDQLEYYKSQNEFGNMVASAITVHSDVS